MQAKLWIKNGQIIYSSGEAKTNTWKFYKQGKNGSGNNLKLCKLYELKLICHGYAISQ